MLLKYEGPNAKFTAYGVTWNLGDIRDVELPEGEIAWLTRHGFSVRHVPKVWQPAEPPPPEPENIMDPLPRRRGRGRRG